LQKDCLGSLTPIIMDITDAMSINSAFKDVKSLVGEKGLCGLINNAGVATLSPLELLPISELRYLLEVNLIGHMAVTQSFLPLLRQGKGRIINIGSVIGRMALPFLGVNSASKFALEALTDALRMELQPWNIPVSIIEPGYINTSLWSKATSRGEVNPTSVDHSLNGIYESNLSKARRATILAGQKGRQPLQVAKVVGEALMVRIPKTRYLVGSEAYFVSLLGKFFPDRLRDWILTR
jgi:NAD(P)-dependent dehydrogenase (short-subunit alcohol dehydrogenase family)